VNTPSSLKGDGGFFFNLTNDKTPNPVTVNSATHGPILAHLSETLDLACPGKHTTPMNQLSSEKRAQIAEAKAD